ncbi:MAG: addiction module protein [Gammaproteobacteria bacterium]|nr:addiction module protein [Gammaproteobacteria bacterium]
METPLLEQARMLPLEDQLALVEALWDSISHTVPLTTSQKDELDRRMNDLDANPDDVSPWGEVKASALVRIGR